MLGTFHEISISTADIRASVEFYEQLGFSQCVTGDTWPHPYGVLTDGHVFIGLHEYEFASPSITTVRPGIANCLAEFADLGITLAFAKVDEDHFNEIGFRDPAGQMLTVLEARTYSPPANATRSNMESQCGYFAEFSIPCTDFSGVAAFWERLGFVALQETDQPYVSQALTSDSLSIALHRPRTCEQPMLVFRDPAMRERVARLRAADTQFSADLPRGLDPACNGLLIAPEGTPLLLLQDV